ncbi:MAG TPA: ATP-binding protein, partial [bacterium]
LMVNAAYAAAHGISKEDALQSSLEDLPGGGPEKPFWTEADRQVLETGESVHLDEVPFTAPGGKIRLRTLYKFPFRNPQGELVGILGVSEDITDRKREELALFQAQKMESLGLLAGGVAHDFNNLLMAISGNALLAMADLPGGNRAAECLRSIQSAAEMGAGLTRQMLAIAGKARIQSEAIDVSHLAGNIVQLLRAVVPKSVELRQELAAGLRTITADPSQIQQVTMNLVRNAADAIAAEGVIVIRTGQLFAAKAYLAECQFGSQQEEGVFVYIEVSDTGFGMAPETVQRIFDPFYTTKVTGRGLGLAAVLAIVRNHKGVLRVTSELGQGTTFRILLPADIAAGPEAAPAYQR